MRNSRTRGVPTHREVVRAAASRAGLRYQPQCSLSADPLCCSLSMKPHVQPALARMLRGPAPMGRGKRAAPSPPPVPYSAFIAYSSVPAARRALAHLNRLVRARGDELVLQPMLWRCDQLEHPLWCAMALRDAARANVLVVALAGSAPLEVATEKWLTQLASHIRGTELIAFAFTEDDEGWTISLQARTQRSPAPLAQIQTPPLFNSATNNSVPEETEAARAA